VELIREVLTALRIPSLSLEGYEADDLIATLATAAEAEDYDVLIVTGDRDTFQLVTDRVTVLYAVRGVSELARMTPAAVFDRYGLTRRSIRLRRVARRPVRQPAAFRGRGEDRGEVGARVRLVRRTGRPGR
jgi:5'-3' exonuclease